MYARKEYGKSTFLDTKTRIYLNLYFPAPKWTLSMPNLLAYIFVHERTNFYNYTSYSITLVKSC